MTKLYYDSNKFDPNWLSTSKHFKSGITYNSTDPKNYSSGGTYDLTNPDQSENFNRYFSKSIIPTQDAQITLDINVQDEQPSNRPAIAKLISDTLTEKKSCITKLNVYPENFFSEEQKNKINNILADNKK